jgi:bacterioferritin-associated ferredoxin
VVLKIVTSTREPLVILCVCFNISDRAVRDRAQEGASLHAVMEETGAGSACGACRLAVARVFAGAQAVSAPCAAMREQQRPAA